MLEQLFKYLPESIVLRNYEYLPKSTGGSDLDIAIPKHCLEETETILFKLAKENKGYLVSYVPSKTCPKYCFQGVNWGLQIDLFIGGVSINNKIVFSYGVLEKFSTTYNGISVLENATADIISFLKEVINNLFCKKKYFDGFKQTRNIELLNNLLEKVLSEKLIHQLFEIEDYNKQELQNLGVSLRKELKINHLNILTNKLSNIHKRLEITPGYTIAFLGTDGSGKSTIIELITPILNEAFHNSVFYEHMRPNKFPSLAKLMGKKEDFSSTVNNPHSQKESGFLGSLFRFSYYYLDYSIGYLVKIFPKKIFKSYLWIFDRYYYDYLLDQKRARIKLPKFIINLGAFFIPKPDIIICLGTDAEKIYERKPEIPFKEVKRQVEDLKAFSNNNKRAIWVDTGVDIETSKTECLEHIINFMAQRYKTYN